MIVLLPGSCDAVALKLPQPSSPPDKSQRRRYIWAPQAPVSVSVAASPLISEIAHRSGPLLCSVLRFVWLGYLELLRQVGLLERRRSARQYKLQRLGTRQ